MPRYKILRENDDHYQEPMLIGYTEDMNEAASLMERAAEEELYQKIEEGHKVYIASSPSVYEIRSAFDGYLHAYYEIIECEDV